MMKSYLVAIAVAAIVCSAWADDWETCGGLAPMYNRTACPSSKQCCKMLWSPSDGQWGCCPYENAVCCDGGYTCCPEGTTCQNSGSGYSVVSTCVNATAKVTGAEVCKQGPPTPFNSSLPSVMIIGDSVSIGYTPVVAEKMAQIADVQHSPWGGDGGAEETQYGSRCMPYLVRAPNGAAPVPDVVFFNFGLHNVLSGNNTVPGQGGPPDEYLPYLKDIVSQLKAFCVQPKCKLMFAITSPVLCKKDEDDVLLGLNSQAAALMKENDIPTVDLHAAIVNECGPVPQASCFGIQNCWCPHCPGVGYEWLANSTVVPAIQSLLGL